MKLAILLGIPAVLVGTLCSTVIVGTILMDGDSRTYALLEDSTLVQKCDILEKAYKDGDYVGIFETSLAIKDEHRTPPRASSKQVCSRVGDYEWVDGSESGTRGMDKVPIR